MSPRAIRELFERAPVTVRGFIAFGIIEAVATPVITGRAWSLLLVPISVVFWVLILRGSRVVWLLYVCGGGLYLIIALFGGPSRWWPFTLVSTVLLVWPSSFRFIWHDRPRLEPPAEPPGASAERRDSGGTRIGWHVDPENPARMNYWHGAERGWSGSTRTPRKVKREWEQAAAVEAEQVAEPE